MSKSEEGLINILMLLITTIGLILFNVIGILLKKHKPKKIKKESFDKYDIEAFLKEAY